MREQTIVAWGDVPFVHFVTAVYLDIVNDDASQTRAQAQASTADRETANDCGETPECWAWTGAKDGGIVRWSLNESAARRVGNVGAVNHCSGHDAAIVHGCDVDERGAVMREHISNLIVYVCGTEVGPS